VGHGDLVEHSKVDYTPTEDSNRKVEIVPCGSVQIIGNDKVKGCKNNREINRVGGRRG